MSETAKPNLSGVAETSLITLYLRAMGSQRPDTPMKDERAEAVVRQLDQELLRSTLPPTKDSCRVAMISKTREFDRFTRNLLVRRSRMQRAGRYTGEGLVFGIEEGRVEAFLLARGYTHIQNVTSQDLERMYFTGVNEARAIASVYAVAHAVVGK